MAFGAIGEPLFARRSTPEIREGEIRFHLAHLSFDALPDEQERAYFQ